jgi:hypothetical protein
MNEPELESPVTEDLPVDPPELKNAPGAPYSIWLLLLSPAKAFATFDRDTRIETAAWIFWLYFVARLPTALHRASIKGQLEEFGWIGQVIVVGGGMILAVIATFVMMLILGAIVHIIANKLARAGRTPEDAVVLSILCLAPQLLVILTLPLVIIFFHESTAFYAMLRFRVGLDIFSVFLFYSGLIHMFGLSRVKAALITLLPAIPVVLLMLTLIMPMLGP